MKNVIDVFTYETGERSPKIEKIQTVSTTGEEYLTRAHLRLRHEDVAGSRSSCSAATRGTTP